MSEKKPKLKLGLKNLAKLPNHFDYIFVHLRQKACFRTKISPNFLSTLVPNRPELEPKSPAQVTTLSGHDIPRIKIQVNS